MAAHGLTFIGPSAAVLERFASKAGTRRLLGAHGLPTIPGSDGMLRDEMHALERGGADRLPGAHQAVGRRRRQGHAHGPHAARARVRPRGLPLRGEGRLRRRLALPREVARREPPRRDPGRRRSLRPRRPPRRARLLGPAAPPEDPRGGPDAGADRCRPGRPRRARDPGGRRGRLRERRHARVPRRPDRRVLLHRDQLPDPGRAPGDRDADRASTSWRPRSGSRPASRSASRQADVRVPRPRHRVPDQRRGPGPRVPARAPASSSATTPRVARASAWTRTCTPATRSRRSTTRCSASSSSGARTGQTAIARGRVALDELVVDGLVTNVAIHQALLANEAFLEGRMTTNLLDRVGSAAIPRRGGASVTPARRGRCHVRCIPAPTVPPCAPRPRPAHAGALDRPRPNSTARPTRTHARDRGTIHTTREIEALIPHRWPFLLVDRIVEYDAEAKRIVGHQGRDRDRVVLPGPLPGAAGHAGRPPGRGARPDDGRLRRQAARASATGSGCSPASTTAASSASSAPGDTLRLEVTMEKLGGRFGRGRGVASVDGETACEATLTSSSRAKACCDDPRRASCPTSTATRSRSRPSARRSGPRSRTSSRSPATSSSTGRTRPARSTSLREMEADGAVIVSGNTDIAVADFDYAAAFPWMTDGVPDIVPGRRRVGPRRARRRAARLAPPAAGRAPPARRGRDDDPRLPRLAGLADRRASTRRSTRTSSSSASRGPTRASSPAATPTSPRSATSAGSSSSTTAPRATSSTATRPRRGRCIDLVDGEVTAEIRRTEFDALAVANAISARGLAGRRLPGGDGPHREAGPMTERRRVVVTGMGAGHRARQRRRRRPGRASSPAGPASGRSRRSTRRG